MENSLKSIFKKNRIHYDDFSKKTGISKARLYTYFNKKLEEFKPYEISLLCSLLPIEPNFFGADNSIFSFKKEKSEEDALISFSYLRKNGRVKNYDAFLTLYFDTLIHEVNKAKKSIVILDYVGDNLYTQHKSDDLSNFHSSYKKFLEAITQFIRRRKSELEAENAPTEVVFTRILQCPINIIPHTKDFHHKIDEVLDLSYGSMYEQFESLWPDCKDFFKLCYVEKAFRPYSVMIVDGENITTEYVRYNKELQPIPDILFTDHRLQFSGSDVANVLIESHMSDIERVIHDNSRIITRKQAFLGLKSLESVYQSRYSEMEDELKKVYESIKLHEERLLGDYDLEKEKKDNKLVEERNSYLRIWEFYLALQEKHAILKERMELTAQKLKFFFKNTNDS